MSVRAGQALEGDDAAVDADKGVMPFAGFVVAIGASAGGLDALERLFGALPVDSGAAFVVVQHLSPDHKSMMDNLLARYTRMPVRVAEHDMPLSANAVFLIPPGKFLALLGDRLQLAPKPEHGLTLPIDIFFSSLSEQCQERAIAIVMSGTGSDGARGLVNVNAGGGFVFVQDPTTAKFDGMPRSAMATGLVDLVAAPEALAAGLVKHMSAPGQGAVGDVPLRGDPGLAPVDKILARLVETSGIDFRDYKQNTVHRRIERRLKVLHCKDLGEYLEKLSTLKEEQLLLRRELLIPVTRFFRDTEAFERLANDVIPAIVSQHSSASPIRVWVACTATGEEAYSIAILFAEAFERHRRAGTLKIFATDIEPLYLEQAGAGVYPEAIAAEVSAERLERYFTRGAGTYTVRPEIRQSVIFARHNLISDPPFTRMDLVTCRNALIYWKPLAQERALHRLQYALVPQGFLFLGPSETLGPVHRDFTAVYAKQKIYRLVRKTRASAVLGSFSQPVFPTVRSVSVAAPAVPVAPEGGLVELGQRQLVRGYVPPSVLVGETRELLHVYGDARAFLRVPEGQASLDVVKLMPREMSWAATALLLTVAREKREVRSPPLQIGEPDAPRTLVLVARPVGTEAADSLPALLSFEIQRAPDGGQALAQQAVVQLTNDERAHMELLERELNVTRESLQATIEELETSNEELQATNEELMASNEELQSTNEELQSVNEELYTVNSEFQEKVDILNMLNADLENVSTASGIPTVFVDQDLRLTRFTPEAGLIFKVRESDVGRSLDDFAHSLDYPELFNDLKRTIASGVVTEREVRGRAGQWWMARIQPYSDTARLARRAVMAFFDVTSVKDSQRLQAIVDSLPEQIAVLDETGTITLVNAAWRRFAQDNGDPTLNSTGPGNNYLRACRAAAAHDGYARQVEAGLSAVLSGALKNFSIRYPCHAPNAKRWFLMHAAPVHHRGGGAVVSHINIDAWAAAPDADECLTLTAQEPPA